MIILKSFLHETIWGGDRLKQYIDENVDKIGHLYSVAGSKSKSNMILNGEYKGKDFYTYFNENKNKYGLSDYEEYPLTIALVDASDNLSIQVHPSKKTAYELENKESGKNESFYILVPPSNGEMYNGCKCNSIEEVENKIKYGQSDQIADKLKVQKGDYIYVTEGTLHSLSAGALVYEIEENCEYTYRLYDFERLDSQGNKRPLDIEKVLKALDVSKKSVVKKYNNKEIEENRYITKLVENVSHYKNHSDTLECLTILEGNGMIDGILIKIGMSIILEPDEQVDNINIIKAIAARTK